MDVVVVGGDLGLSDHPAREDVVSLIRQLVLDSLLMPPPNKPPSTIDYVLDVSSGCPRIIVLILLLVADVRV